MVRNTAIEKVLNQKMCARYFGPMVVILRNRRGAYIACDLDGTLVHAPIAAFRIILYFAWEHLDLPDIEQHLDISAARLHELEDTTAADPDECATTNATIEETKDTNNTDSNDDGHKEGDMEHSREEILVDSTLYPFFQTL